MPTETYRSNPYDLAVDTISEEDLSALAQWIAAYPRLTMDQVTRRFEQEWARWLGVRYGVMTNSGSSANLLMYAALDSTGRAGRRRVIVPATGWATTIAPAIQLGWRPDMCGTDPSTYGLDAGHLRRLLEREPADAVILVHTLGVPAQMGPLLELQQRHGFALMEDCCASHGARHQGRLVGTLGVMSSFSFYYGHHMSTIEGGMVCTDDEHLYHHLLMLRSHGWLKDLPEAIRRRMEDQYAVDPFGAPFTFAVPGFNVRPTDLSAKIGLMQLERLDQTNQRRAANHRIYQQRLAGALEYAKGLEGDVPCSISFCAVADSSAQRKEIISRLVAAGVDTRLFTAGNLGRHPFWVERYGVFSSPVADKLHSAGFFLPNNQALGGEDIARICDVVTGALG